MEMFTEIKADLTLEDVLEYKNLDLIDKFIENFDVKEHDTVVIFEDLLRWLWLNVEANRKGFTNLYINHDLLIIDEMWHTFILFTKEYEAFCKECFGYFIHHSPTTKPEKEKMEKEFLENQEVFMEKRDKEMEFVYEFIYDQLGNEVLNRWYLEYPSKYSAEQIHNLRKY